MKKDAVELLKKDAVELLKKDVQDLGCDVPVQPGGGFR